MPDFQFTPILTVRTNDAGVLVALDWDWSDSGQGQWNPVTAEHEETAAHLSVCASLDKLPTRWVPDGVASIVGDRMHEPVTPAITLLDTVERLANKHQQDADARARKAHPNHPGPVRGHDETALLLRSIAEQLRAIVVPREARILKVEEHPEDPDPTYRWQAHYELPWLRDGDGLARHELIGGNTREEALASAKRCGEAFAAAGALAPGEWPEGL